MTKKELDLEYTHRHGGNGWAIAQDLDKDYCRVVSLGRGQIGGQAFLAAKNLLTPTKELDDAVAPLVKRLQDDIKSGAVFIDSTRIKHAPKG